LNKRGGIAGEPWPAAVPGCRGSPVSQRRYRWPGECAPPQRSYLSPALLERLNQEIKRRTHVVRIFPGGEQGPVAPASAVEAPASPARPPLKSTARNSREAAGVVAVRGAGLFGAAPGGARLAMPRSRAKGRALSQSIDTLSVVPSKLGFARAGEGLRLGEKPAGHSIFANEVDELALDADPVGAENARLIGRIGGF